LLRACAGHHVRVRRVIRFLEHSHPPRSWVCATLGVKGPW
jgi:hypothetical protein